MFRHGNFPDPRVVNGLVHGRGMVASGVRSKIERGFRYILFKPRDAFFLNRNEDYLCALIKELQTAMLF